MYKSTTGSISSETLFKLSKFDSPTITNIIELFNVRPRNQGYMDRRIESRFPELAPMVGFATTAQFRSDAPSVGGDAYGDLENQLEGFEKLSGPAIVVFQDTDDPPVAAVFGEVMVSTYQAYGAVGLVTNGAGRDFLQIRELKFPVFTKSTIVSHGYTQILHLGQPIRIGGLMVYQDDLLHGDANGVTNIPTNIASEVADLGDEFVAAEAIVMDYVKGPGEKSIAEFVKRRQEFLAVVTNLTKRVARLGAH